MPDREKVIKGLECCKWSRQNVKPEKNKCDECPYKDQGIMNAFSVWRSCTNVLAGDALAILKEKEPVRPIIEQEMDDICSCIENVVYCGRCGARIGRSINNYCSECGQKVKWV